MKKIIKVPEFGLYCPVCNGNNIRRIHRKRFERRLGRYISFYRYICRDCDHKFYNIRPFRSEQKLLLYAFTFALIFLLAIFLVKVMT